MNKVLEAIDSLQNSYDAFYMGNRYGLKHNTHKEEFELIENELADDNNKVAKALNWIKNCYDCYYKDDYNDDESAFGYLRKLCKKEK